MQLTNKFIIYVIVFQVLTLFADFSSSQAQNLNSEQLSKIKDEFDKAYGVDYTLVNGKKYVNFYASATGHPFLNNPDFETGWLNIKDKVYSNQVINYDIYNQEIIAEYKSELIGTQRYIIPSIFLEAFGMNGREFIKLEIGDRQERFYELISNGKDSLLLTHEKLYSINRSSNSSGFLFSQTITRKYFFRNHELIRFKNNRTFRKLFKPEIQDDIKSYMKASGIRIKKTSPVTLKRLMNYINTL